MLNLLKPFVRLVALLLIELGVTGVTEWWSGVLIGAGCFWLVLAIFGHRELLRKAPWLLEWLPFLDPAGAFAGPDQLTGKYLTGHSFEIARLARNNKIENRTFEDCDLYGPAVLAFGDALGIITECTFNAREPGEVVIVLDRSQSVQGPIRAIGCVFRNCRFHGIGFIGGEALLAKFTADMR